MDLPAGFNMDIDSMEIEENTKESTVDLYEDSMELFFNIKNKQKDKNVLNNINVRPVSYTHLDVYKRQVQEFHIVN